MSSKLRLWTTGAVVVLWVAAVVVAAVFHDTTMLKAVTPVLTLVLGWLFAEKATSG